MHTQKYICTGSHGPINDGDDGEVSTQIYSQGSILNYATMCIRTYLYRNEQE